jgi:hypothetical protein
VEPYRFRGVAASASPIRTPARWRIRDRSARGDSDTSGLRPRLVHPITAAARPWSSVKSATRPFIENDRSGTGSKQRPLASCFRSKDSRAVLRGADGKGRSRLPVTAVALRASKRTPAYAVPRRPPTPPRARDPKRAPFNLINPAACPEPRKLVDELRNGHRGTDGGVGLERVAGFLGSLPGGGTNQGQPIDDSIASTSPGRGHHRYPANRDAISL